MRFDLVAGRKIVDFEQVETSWSWLAGVASPKVAEEQLAAEDWPATRHSAFACEEEKSLQEQHYRSQAFPLRFLVHGFVLREQ